MAILDPILKFQSYESKPCSNLIVCIIKPLNIIKKSNLKCFIEYVGHIGLRIVSEYDQEIPQSQTADNPVAPRGRAAQPSRLTDGHLGRHL